MTAKLSALGLLSVFAAILAGCAQFDSVKDRFSPAPPQTRVVQGQPRDVYRAALQVMGRFGYAVVGGGAAQGRIEGLTEIGAGDGFGAVRQRSISINLVSVGEGTTEVQVLIKETSERDSDRPGGGTATELALRDPAAYAGFFNLLEQTLKAAKGG